MNRREFIKGAAIGTVLPLVAGAKAAERPHAKGMLISAAILPRILV